MRRLASCTFVVMLASCGAPHAPTDGGGVEAGDACVPAASDGPDSRNVDENCDGIDGDAHAAIFVATDGDDSAAGTRSAPLATIGAALARADHTGATQVLVALGRYTESHALALLDGIGIYGGYDRAHAWARGVGDTVINVPSVGIDAVGLRGATEVMRVSIVAADNTVAGGSSIAVRVVDSQGLAFGDGASITAGHAGNGRDGGPGSIGADGDNGVVGAAGSVDAQDHPGAGGYGGQNAMCRDGDGGNGGSGGERDNSFTGWNGRASVAGTHGGAGASTTSCTGHDGAAGSDGAAASAGASGHAGLAFGAMDAAGFAYVPARGGDALAGATGAGGGGGGGSSGQTGTFCTNGAGNGGGGGGAGGCGGTGGAGGDGGGASIAIALWRSNVSFDSVHIVARGGGAGGRGGTGGAGGHGGTGADGASVGVSEIGRAGRGGDGGSGGLGGRGGGGGGGPTIGVWRDANSVVAMQTVTFDVAAGGVGGISGGINDGAQGQSARMLPTP